ncbi:MAG TPA: UTP--glucose-1-phosphate uridylyltransferase, partial [Candidatus Syntrophosphaera thermopropionivorans]|nr:UTP--glucose-1-phosphate uridylyltransferase [Candidatus Syntrophosphaera thermopropionivorans]
MLNQFIRMMKAESIPESVIRTFCIYYNQLVKGERGIIPSSEINPPKEDNLLQYSALNDYRKQSMLKQ